MLFAFLSFPCLMAQRSSSETPAPSVKLVSKVFQSPGITDGSHRFWDKQSRVLFITAGAMNAADFAVTRMNLQSGGQELNPLVRIWGCSSPGLALNFSGGTVGMISLSYFLHKTGHHKLERAVPFVNIVSATGAVTYGLTHR